MYLKKIYIVNEFKCQNRKQSFYEIKLQNETHILMFQFSNYYIRQLIKSGIEYLNPFSFLKFPPLNKFYSHSFKILTLHYFVKGINFNHVHNKKQILYNITSFVTHE